MLKKAATFTRKRALTIILFASILIFLLILGKWLIAYRNNSGIMTLDGRESFLMSLGWKIDRNSEEIKNIRLPERFDEIMAEYNKLQRTQGYDLEKYAGKDCTQYTYRVLNYNSGQDEVYVSLYLCGRSVIGGDIHTASSDGFMHAIRKAPRA